MDLSVIYKKLQFPRGTELRNSGYYIARSIQKFPLHKLAKDSHRYPCLLISTKESSEYSQPASIKLENLSVINNVECKILDEKTVSKVRKYTVISCTSDDPAIQNYFLKTIGTIIPIIGDSPSLITISNAVDKLVELFSALTKVPYKSVQGLWAELFLISISNNPEIMVRSWHQSPLDKYDFSYNTQRVEVKSSTTKERKHSFSIEQISPNLDLKILVASIFVERLGTGLSISELLEIIKKRTNFDPDIIYYLDYMVGIILGRDWHSATIDKFDYNLAKKSLNFYYAKDIPTINSYPPEISDIHFKVDIAKISTVNHSCLKQQGGIFKFIVPR